MGCGVAVVVVVVVVKNETYIKTMRDELEIEDSKRRHQSDADVCAV